MALICYQPKKFQGRSQEMISLVNNVITTYQAQGYDLTLRQVYYQMVARGYIPNNDKEYKKLGSLINDARLAGEIDWYAIQDRTRYLREQSHWDNPAQIIRSAALGYSIDKWLDQTYYVEVWVEKDALIGVVEKACEELGVSCFSCRGYVSQSEMWVAAQRLIGKANESHQCLLLHLGDHDPSGIDMSRDIEERIRGFWDHHYNEDDDAYYPSDEVFEFKRIALNWDQVREYNPPPNPTKLTDARATGYIRRFGRECWELDALEPAQIGSLIEEHVLDIREEDKWDTALEREQDEQSGLKLVHQNWNKVVDFVGGLDNA